MASPNTRHFEVRLRKQGMIMLTLGMSLLLFAAFVFGVAVGSDLENYPGKIARQMPLRFLEWIGLGESEKPVSVAVVVKNDKPVVSERPRESEPPPIAVIPAPVAPEKKEPVAQSVSARTGNADAKPPLPKKEGAAGISVVPVAPDKDAGADRFLVQVTSCRDKKIAEDVVRRIGKIGYKARIDAVDLEKKGRWYRVLLSDFPSREKAQEAARKVDGIFPGNKSSVRVQ